MKLWPILASLFGPGVAQAMMGRRRTAIAFVVVFAIALLSIGFSIYGLAAAIAVWIVSTVETIVYVIRTPAPVRDRTLEAAIVWASLVVVAGVTRAFVAEAFKFPSSSMVPTFQVDDHVFISKLASYGRGDVIVFDHPCAHRAYAKRIVALANDTVEVRCNVLFVNGKPQIATLVAAEAHYLDRNDAEWFRRNASHYRETLDGKTHDIFDRADRPQTGGEDQKDFPRERETSCANQADLYGEDRVTNQQPGKIVDGAPPTDPCAPHRHYVVPAGHVFVLGDSRNNSNDSRFWGSVPVENIQGRVVGIWRPLARFGPIH